MNQLLEDGGNESWFSDYAGVILTSIAVFLVVACKFQFTLHLSWAHCVRVSNHCSGKCCKNVCFPVCCVNICPPSRSATTSWSQPPAAVTTTSASTSWLHPNQTGAPGPTQDQSRENRTISGTISGSMTIYTISAGSGLNQDDLPPSYQSQEASSDSPPTYQAATSGGFREENYKTDYSSAFTIKWWS